jgi:ubiquinone/menaquinone biosynthesis C-methylase UbiE
MTQINDPELVRSQYADEANLGARKAIYANAEGPDARELAFQAVAECGPRRVLEVGGGEGELAERIVRELGAELVFVDQSERMVEIARGRGLAAQVGDVQDLPFADASFDCAVAAWMLYHVPALDQAIAELARVLVPGGRLVAVTNGAGHLAELREVAGHEHFWTGMPFRRENGAELIAPSFSAVEARDADGWVSIADDDAIWSYLRSMTGFDPPTELQPHDLPLRVRRCSTIFVATR